MSDDGIIVIAPHEAYQHMVKNFHMGIGGQGPDVELRVSLIQEEAQEWIDAVKNRDAVAAIDAFCDLLYVTYGTADVFKVYLNTTEAAKTPPQKGGPKWAALNDEIEDFNLTVSDVVKCIRTFQAFNAKGKLESELTELAQGCWECAAEGIGVDLRPYFREVHRTNMHKLQGPKREDGKQLKPPGWKPPRIKYMYERELAGSPTFCNVICGMKPYIVDHSFDISERLPHSDGGYYCARCGGVFLDVELDIGMENRDGVQSP